VKLYNEHAGGLAELRVQGGNWQEAFHAFVCNAISNQVLQSNRKEWREYFNTQVLHEHYSTAWKVEQDHVTGRFEGLVLLPPAQGTNDRWEWFRTTQFGTWNEAAEAARRLIDRLDGRG
jgi:hypothetical protein